MPLLIHEHEMYFLCYPCVAQHLCQIVDQGICLQGDGNIRYYEVVDQAPWLHYLNQFLSGSPQVRFCYNGITVHPHLSVFMVDK